MKFPDGNLTYGQTLGPAMEISNQKDADEYLEALIEYYMRDGTKSKNECRELALNNLGYFAGYYDQETANRVKKLFGALHPIFGSNYFSK